MIVGVVTFPLHLAYAFTFRDVITTHEVHGAIESGPPAREVRGVGADDIRVARCTAWAITGAQLALIPFAVRATRRAFEVDESGIPTAPDSWRHAFQRDGVGPGEGISVPAALLAVVGAAAVGLLLAGVGSTLLDFVSDKWRWVGVALVGGTVPAAASPFALGALAALRAKEGAPSAPKLY